MPSFSPVAGCVSCLVLFASLVSPASAQLAGTAPIQRPTFNEPWISSTPGKIVLEEHVSSNIFNAAFTNPFVNNTNEILFGQASYRADVASRLNETSIAERVHQMDLANISISVLSLIPPGIQGIFDTKTAVTTAAAINDNMANVYANGNYSARFRFFCSVALQQPSTAVAETRRCIRKLGGVGVFIGGYTNVGSADNVTYLDNPINEPLWEVLEDLNVPLYLHTRMTPPGQQGVFKDYELLGGSAFGFSAEASMEALRIMVSGVLDRHPKLKIILGHCGEGLPFYLYRTDQRLRHFQRNLWPAKKSLTYYWENNFYVTTSGVQSEATIWDTIKTTGEDRIMFSVDYPFEDDVEIGRWFDGMEMNSNTKHKIASGNARALLKL